MTWRERLLEERGQVTDGEIASSQPMHISCFTKSMKKKKGKSVRMRGLIKLRIIRVR